MEDELHNRLEALSRQIDAKTSEMMAKASWHDGHELTAKELKAKGDHLLAELNEQVKDLEAYGHHVTSFERSVLKWIDRADM